MKGTRARYSPEGVRLPNEPSNAESEQLEAEYTAAWLRNYQLLPGWVKRIIKERIADARFKATGVRSERPSVESVEDGPELRARWRRVNRAMDKRERRSARRAERRDP